MPERVRVARMEGSSARHAPSQTLLRALLVVFGLFLVWRFLAGVASVVLLLAAGLLLAVALSGPVEVLRRYRVPRLVSVALIFLSALALLGAMGFLLFPVLEREISVLVFAVPEAVSNLAARAGELAGRLGLNPGGLSSSTLAGWGRRLVGGALGVFGTVASALFGVLVAVFVSFYLAAKPEPVVRWTVRLFPPDARPRARRVLSEARSTLLGWLKGRLISMLIVGSLSTLALYLIGIPGALSLGIFAGLVSFVPYIGPIVSAVSPALLGLLGDPGDALWVVAAYAAIQQIESYVIMPLVMEETVSLHPAVAIVAVAVFGSAFGVLGAVLALPVTLVGGVLVEELWFRRMEGPREPERNS